MLWFKWVFYNNLEKIVYFKGDKAILDSIKVIDIFYFNNLKYNLDLTY